MPVPLVAPLVPVRSEADPRKPFDAHENKSSAINNIENVRKLNIGFIITILSLCKCTLLNSQNCYNFILLALGAPLKTFTLGFILRSHSRNPSMPAEDLIKIKIHLVML